MARAVICCLLALVAPRCTPAIKHGRELIQAFESEQTGSKGSGNPISKVVSLLKQMSETLNKEMEEDEEQYNKLACWCSKNMDEKQEAVKNGESKVSSLTSDIEEWTAKSAQFKQALKQLRAEVAANKKALAEATKVREKEAGEFHAMEVDNIQAIENLKAAILVLSKHNSLIATMQSLLQGDAPVDEDPWAKDPWSLLETARVSKIADPWVDHMEEESLSHGMDAFMMSNGFSSESPASSAEVDKMTEKFLQQGQHAKDKDAGSTKSEEMSAQEAKAVIMKGWRSAQTFMQAHRKGKEDYTPEYNAQSGAIFGMLKQLREDMQEDLAQAQAKERKSVAAFEELRGAKTKQIKTGTEMMEKKEDELARTDNDLAEAKEDLDKTSKTLEEDTKFLNNLKKICPEAEKDFNVRKNNRMEEIKAVSATIEILTEDAARDAMAGTYNFLQRKATSSNRRAAAEILRKAAIRSRNPELSVLATSVQLDAFTKVKKAINDMVGILKTQQDDEVKKNDWCTEELNENEISTQRWTDTKEDLTIKIASFANTLETLEDEIEAAKTHIAELQVDLQSASMERKSANFEFQTTIADQHAVVEVLKKALQKLRSFYDKEALFLQGRGSRGRELFNSGFGTLRSRAFLQQTPPVEMQDFKPNKGASGVMQMISQLIFEAKELSKAAVHSESNAQAAYETLVADTNDSIAALQKDISSKTKAKAGLAKDKIRTEDDLEATEKELDGLAKYDKDLHEECDYVMKNFDVRQSTRAQEIDALQQALSILSGATYK